jgi:hypothetical protein
VGAHLQPVDQLEEEDLFLKLEVGIFLQECVFIISFLNKFWELEHLAIC